MNQMSLTFQRAQRKGGKINNWYNGLIVSVMGFPASCHNPLFTSFYLLSLTGIDYDNIHPVYIAIALIQRDLSPKLQMYENNSWPDISMWYAKPLKDNLYNSIPKSSFQLVPFPFFAFSVDVPHPPYHPKLEICKLPWIIPPPLILSHLVSNLGYECLTHTFPHFLLHFHPIRISSSPAWNMCNSFLTSLLAWISLEYNLHLAFRGTYGKWKPGHLISTFKPSCDSHACKWQSPSSSGLVGTTVFSSLLALTLHFTL